MGENIMLRAFFEMKRRLENVLLWPGLYTHLGPNGHADSEMTTLIMLGRICLLFQIPEARTQAIFSDCQLHIWAVEGRQECLSK